VLLCGDWTLLRLFPPLRAAWALQGTQAAVPITGANAKRVLFGAINLCTAHRIVLVRSRAGGADARAFLRELRRRYRAAGTIWLLVDRASAHTADRTQVLAAALGIRLLWLPKQAPELNAMDQLWRDLKRLVAANRQATCSVPGCSGTIDRQAARDELWARFSTAAPPRLRQCVARYSGARRA
jgi:transposase